MAYYCCMACDYEAHFTEFRVDSDKGDGVTSDAGSENDEDVEEEDELVCPVCQSEGVVEL